MVCIAERNVALRTCAAPDNPNKSLILDWKAVDSFVDSVSASFSSLAPETLLETSSQLSPKSFTSCSSSSKLFVAFFPVSLFSSIIEFFKSSTPLIAPTSTPYFLSSSLSSCSLVLAYPKTTARAFLELVSLNSFKAISAFSIASSASFIY
jgi:hypothetical protein